MISAISWVPKGASKAEPVVADPPSKEEIEEFINNTALERRYLSLLSILLSCVPINAYY